MLDSPAKCRAGISAPEAQISSNDRSGKPGFPPVSDHLSLIWNSRADFLADDCRVAGRPGERPARGRTLPGAT
jgi:hypothetical protein